MALNSLAAVDPDQWASASWPLGSHPDGDAFTFAVVAPAASRIQLEFYEAAVGVGATWSTELARGNDGVWRGRVVGVTSGALYGYRAWGDNWPFDPGWQPGTAVGFRSDLDSAGNRFNPNKVLFDPYAREVSHTMFSDVILSLGEDGGIFGTGGGEYHGRPRREADTARVCPKGIVLVDQTPVGTKPRIPAEKAAIYEVAVRQLTGHPSTARLSQLLADEPGFGGVPDIPAEARGTYRGAGLIAPYLKALGFTAVELLPVQATNSSESGRQGYTNAWGYMTLSFFAPNREYAADRSPGGPTAEFKQMVSAFHDAGLEVYLDVVYNHTAEGGNWGDLDTVGFTSLGGFATAEYYQMTSSKLLVDGATGTANQVNFASGPAKALVLDSLAYWTREMGVDGFRFDLATVLGREPDASAPDDWMRQKRFFTDHPLLVDVANFAQAEDIEVIAEAWDLWGYEVGNFPNGWGEWNGRFRDAVRRFGKGDGNLISFLDMFNGDHHHFADQGGAQKSINFLDAHDGFPLADLVSYNHKANDQPFPFGPSDGGSDNNLSWDSGGDHAFRRQRIRNFLTLLFFARGVPMIVAGDEFGRTQNGNNNPWALQTVAMWNNYAMIHSNAPQRVPVADGIDQRYHDNLGSFDTPPTTNGLFRFTSFLANLRQRHAALQQRDYGDLVVDNGDVSYLFHTPSMQGYPEEGHRAVAVHINAPGDDFWILINLADYGVEFSVPSAPEGSVWRRLVDTGSWAESATNCWAEGTGMIVSGPVIVEPWSVVVWHQSPTPDGSRPVPVWRD